MTERSGKAVLVVGHALLDVELTNHGAGAPRLGGIFHAARALWAAGCPFGIAYCAPDYMRPLAETAARQYGALSIHQMATVSGSPGVMLIGEAKECGPQGYEYLLRNDLKVYMIEEQLKAALQDADWTDVLVVAGEFDLASVVASLATCPAEIDIDVGNYEGDWEVLGELPGRLRTVMVSTSSPQFPVSAAEPLVALADRAARAKAQSLLVKENRGGSRYCQVAEPGSIVAVGAQLRRVRHSVGVGDCFDAVFAALRGGMADDAALAYAACAAAEYAVANTSQSFRASVQGWLAVPPETVRELRGVSLPWEDRAQCNVYIAAPDFDYVDRAPLERLVTALRYHNFRPRRPVEEHGQASPDATAGQKKALLGEDIRLLLECSMVVAVLLYDDPGTLIEIGFALGHRIPVIVYDPYRRATNLMLTQAPPVVSSELDAVVGAVFDIASRRRESGK